MFLLIIRILTPLTPFHLFFSGGRQVDGAIASLFALERICQSPKIRQAQQDGKLTVLFDSGIRTGSDIMKALALGAQAILREYAVPCPWFCLVA